MIPNNSISSDKSLDQVSPTTIEKKYHEAYTWSNCFESASVPMLVEKTLQFFRSPSGCIPPPSDTLPHHASRDPFLGPDVDLGGRW